MGIGDACKHSSRDYPLSGVNLSVPLQAVGRRTEIQELDDWGDRAKRTQIVAIGESGGFDAQELNNKFDACLA